MKLEDLKNNMTFGMLAELGMSGYDIDPFGEEPSNAEPDDFVSQVERLKLSIEIEGIRYFFETLEKYKAFKKEFNLL